MRANSKVAILVVSMFVLTALAPAVTVFCGNADAADDVPTVKGVNTTEATIFTDVSTDYGSLVYLSDLFPTKYSEDIADWVYDDTAKYWVNNNEKSANYGRVLTYGYFGMSEKEIKQDIINAFYRDDVIDENGVKYVVTGSTIGIGSGLAYAIDPSTKVITITLAASWSIFAIYDQVGRDVTVGGLSGTTISFTIDYNGFITIYNSSTPVVDSACKLILSDGVSTYNVMRNTDPEKAKFQLLQATFLTDSICNATISIEKSTAPNVTTAITADLEFAGCYFSELQYNRVYVIDTTDGDIKPLQKSGTYTVRFNDITNGTVESKEVKADNSASIYYVYGTVTDSEGGKLGMTVTNPLYGAKVTYLVTKSNGETYTDWATVSTVTDDTGAIADFFRMEAEYGSSIHVSDVELKGYSFDEKYGGIKTYDVPFVSGNISPLDSTCCLKSVERTVMVTVTDQTGIPAADCVIKAEWWYQFRSVVSKEYPSEATGYKGSLPVDTFTTDSNGRAWVSFSEPTGVDEYLLLASCDYKDDATYTFDVVDTSGWTSLTSLPTSVSNDGSKILAASIATLGTMPMKAKEYSFTVTVASNNGRSLEDAGITANWYYRSQDAGSTNSTKVPFTMADYEWAGKVKAATSVTDSSGVIRLVYKVPYFDKTHWDDNLSSCFLYIYGTGFVFDYVTNVGDLTTDPDLTGHDGCYMCKFQYGESESIYSGKNYNIFAEDDLYVVSGTISAHTSAHPVPYAVDLIVTFKDGGTPSSINKTFYRSGSTVTYSFSTIGGRMLVINLYSDGYTFTAKSSIATVESDLVVDYFSDYNESTVADRIPSVPIGITTGYIVSTLDVDDIIRYSYTVGGKERSTMVRASSTSTTFIVKGKAGMSVYMTATDTGDNYFISKFDSTGNAVTVKLKMTNNVFYKNDTDTPLAGYEIDVYYKGEKFCTMKSDSEGVVRVKIPDDEANIKYYYTGYPIVKTDFTTGKYAGYYGFDLGTYVSKNVERVITVTIEYYATSSIDNLSAATCKPIVRDDVHPTTTEIAVGSQKVFMAPELKGFDFAGWYFEGQYYSDSDKKACSFTATGTMDDDVTLCAYYSAKSVEEPEQGVDTTVMVIGIIAVVVAVLALVYVVFQSKRF